MTVTFKLPGRPPLPPGQRKLDSLGFRPTPAVRAKIEAAAKANGRSLSREVESRLEESFLNEEAKYEAFGGRHVYALMRLLGSAVSVIEAGTGRKWRDDRVTYHQVKATIDKLLYGLGPASAGEHDDRTLLEKADAIGETLAAVVLKREDVEAERLSSNAMKLLNLARDLGAAASSEQEWMEARGMLLSKRS